MRLVWRQEALDDRDNIMERIGQENPAAAIELDEAFELKGESARQHPACTEKVSREVPAKSSSLQTTSSSTQSKLMLWKCYECCIPDGNGHDGWEKTLGVRASLSSIILAV